jgi:predicted RNA-binding Zn-ribbon protein involved in translation (DUF1610 family)
MSDRVQKQTAPGSRFRNQGNQHMDCPICGASAQQIPIANDGLSISCPMCGEYDVARAVVATRQLQELEPEQRRDVLDKAKRSAQPGARPLISPFLLA